MNHHVFLLCLLSAFVNISLQCMCFWGYREIEGEKVSDALCFPDQKFIVFKAYRKELQPGDVNSEKILFDVIVSKVITRETGEQVISGGRKITLEAPTGGHLCGYIDFKLGVSGILSVYGPLQDRIKYDACHYYKRESEVTSVQRRLMSGELTCQS